MKLRAPLIAILSLALGWAPGAAAATLSGTVSGQPTGQPAEPVAGATVTVYESAGGAEVGSSVTDALGGYSVTVPDGVFDVRVDPDTGSSFQPTTVHAVEVIGSRTLNVVLVPTDVVRLTGFVRKADGTPVRATLDASGPQGSAHTTSAADGSYTLSLPPGTYRLSANAGEGRSTGLPPEWFVQTPDFELTADSQHDITLPPISTLTVEALGEEDTPIADVLVNAGSYLRADESGFRAGSFELRGFTDSQGRVALSVFEGSSPTPTSKGLLIPPADSGYGSAQFSLPTVSSDTTVAVRFQKATPDLQAPSLTLASQPDAQGGWIPDGPVTVTATAVDPGIATLTCTLDGKAVEAIPVSKGETLQLAFSVAGDGVHHASCVAADKAGNTSEESIDVSVDASPPSSVLSCPVDPLLGSAAFASWTDGDPESGLAGPETGTVALDTSAVGPHTASHLATDNAGHTTTSKCAYRVVYPFAVAGKTMAPPAFNKRPGKKPTVPVEFSLGGDRGLGVFAGGSPTTQPIDCTTGAALGTASPAAGSLTYQAPKASYEFAWDVSALGREGCVALVLALRDGTSHEVWLAL